MPINELVNFLARTGGETDRWMGGGVRAPSSGVVHEVLADLKGNSAQDETTPTYRNLANGETNLSPFCKYSENSLVCD